MFTRLVVTAGIVAALAMAALCVGLGVHWWSGVAVPGWLAYTSGLLLVIVFQAMTFIAALTFLILGSRQQSTFVPGATTRRSSSPSPSRRRRCNTRHDG